MILQYLSAKYTTFRLDLSNKKLTNYDTKITVDTNKQFQTIIGFGGAFTEASAYNFYHSDEATKSRIMELYFGGSGLGYSLGRVHINSSDFSLGNYDYVDESDMSLDSFNIDREFKYVIPFIKEAEKHSGIKFSLLASPWSPPAWMKSNENMNYGGKLLPKYFETWARYYVKFIDAFKNAGLKIDYITVQNEPAATQVWDSCYRR